MAGDMKTIGFWFLGLVVMGCCENPTPPEQAARSFAKDMGVEAVGVSCAKSDSDGDGYVSCAVNTGQKILSLQCAARVSSVGSFGQCVDGCKLTVPVAAKTTVEE